ncbi:unannotated protein [freshwater metagenome]|uniref:Unannotated protein n=1 Tax=freshwater metagenome TaxID=449393 RepID=A0A6J6U1X3_9ZZZZ
MGHLPVHDRDDIAPGVHEVPGSGVALHEHDRPVAVVREVLGEPAEGERDHRLDDVTLDVLLLPYRELFADVLTDARGRAELGQAQLVNIDGMQSRELLHERSRGAHLLGRIVDLGEPVPSHQSFGQERVAGGVDRTEASDTHGRIAQCSIHRALAPHRVKRRGLWPISRV